MKPIRTIKQARKYRDWVKATTGKEHAIFKVPMYSAAWNDGFRFGTCETEEIGAYKLDGATFIEE